MEWLPVIVSLVAFAICVAAAIAIFMGASKTTIRDRQRRHDDGPIGYSPVADGGGCDGGGCDGGGD